MPLSHGVEHGRRAAAGVSRITAWLTQASDKVLPGRVYAASVTTSIDYRRLIIADLSVAGAILLVVCKSSIENHQ
jgi:hypothetical protein